MKRSTREKRGKERENIAESSSSSSTSRDTEKESVAESSSSGSTSRDTGKESVAESSSSGSTSRDTGKESVAESSSSGSTSRDKGKEKVGDSSSNGSTSLDGPLVISPETSIAEKILKEIKERLICPIMQVRMTDPVTGADGHSYERAAITAWIATRGGRALSPMTGARLENLDLAPNHTLRQIISDFEAAKPRLQQQKLTEKDIFIAIQLHEEELRAKLQKQGIEMEHMEEINHKVQGEIAEERNGLKAKYDHLSRHYHRLTLERDGLQKLRTTLESENNRLKAENGALVFERDALRGERDAAIQEQRRFAAAHEGMRGERDRISSERNALLEDRAALVNERDGHRRANEALASQNKILKNMLDQGPSSSPASRGPTSQAPSAPAAPRGPTRPAPIPPSVLSEPTNQAPPPPAVLSGPISQAPSAPAAPRGATSQAPSAPSVLSESTNQAPSAPAAPRGPASQAPSAPAAPRGATSQAPSAPAAPRGPASQAPSAPSAPRRPTSQASSAPSAPRRPISQAPLSNPPRSALKSNVGLTPAQKTLQNELRIACYQGELEKVKELVEKRGADPAIADEQGQQPVSAAIWGMAFDVVSYLESRVSYTIADWHTIISDVMSRHENALFPVTKKQMNSSAWLEHYNSQNASWLYDASACTLRGWIGVNKNDLEIVGSGEKVLCRQSKTGKKSFSEFFQSCNENPWQSLKDRWGYFAGKAEAFITQLRQKGLNISDDYRLLNPPQAQGSNYGEGSSSGSNNRADYRQGAAVVITLGRRQP